MKKALLHTVMVMFAACCMSCIYDYYPEEEVPDENQVTLAFNMRLLGYDATRAGGDLPAERIRTLRVVLVDLGINSVSGEQETKPYVEYNSVLYDISLSGGDYGKEGIAHLQFPKIHAERYKKIYFLINSEQPYLDLEANGKKINLNNSELYLSGDGTAPVIENATFISPQGSYSKNELEKGELLVPMTAFHSFKVPSVKELEEKYPLNANLVYTLSEELYVVRAINKITFDFVNATKDSENAGMDLLVKNWSISRINTGASYLFAHPGENGILFAKTNIASLNAPWMQWLREEAERSRDKENRDSLNWLTEYSMPDEAVHKEYVFSPADEGYILSAPDENNTTVTLRTEPVYFAESRPADNGKPQQYDLAFTVMQKEDGKWNNEYVYRATSSLTASDDGNDFILQSLFRSTHIQVTVTFRSGLGHPVFDIDVHPYGGYTLDPVFGLGQ